MLTNIAQSELSDLKGILQQKCMPLATVKHSSAGDYGNIRASFWLNIIELNVVLQFASV
jgi:hypothetical protein